MLQKAALTAMILSAFLLASCAAPRGLAHKASRPVAVVEQPVLSASEQKFISDFISKPMNWTGTMTDTPFGDEVSVNAGEFYVNGLDQKCRKGFVQEGFSTNQFAVCQNTGSDQYRVVEPLNKQQGF